MYTTALLGPSIDCTVSESLHHTIEYDLLLQKEAN